MRTRTVASVYPVFRDHTVSSYVWQLLQNVCHLLIVKPVAQTPADLQTEVILVQQVMLIHKVRLVKEIAFERRECVCVCVCVRVCVYVTIHHH